MVAIALAVQLAGVSAGEGQPRLSLSLGEIFPTFVADPRFEVAALTSGGCSTLYVVPPKDHCLNIRHEDAWIDLTISWTGSQALPLRRARPGLVALRVQGAPAGVTQWPITTAVRKGPRLDDSGYLVLPPGGRLLVRVNLAGLTRAMPAGAYDVCFQPNLDPPPGVKWSDRGPCYRFVLIEDGSIGARLELLRRRAIEALAGYRCERAAALANEMLEVDRQSAAAYRIRGIVAELERRNHDAIGDYTAAVQLLRAAGDRHLTLSDEERNAAADDLDNWRAALVMANGISLLGDDTDAPVCRPPDK